MRGKQSVNKGIWHIGGTYKRAPRRRQRGGAIPRELFNHQLVLLFLVKLQNQY